MLGGKTVVAIAVGRDHSLAHSLALCSNGTIVAWGANYYGQPGNNYTTSSNVPVVVTSSGVLSSKTIVAIAAGDAHSYAMCSDGALAACG